MLIAITQTLFRIVGGFSAIALYSKLSLSREIPIAFLPALHYTINVNCGASLRSVLRKVGCVRPSFLLKITERFFDVK